MSETRVKIALPKGSLQESTYRLFQRAGWNISTSSRSYFPRMDDPELEAVLIRAQEIARYVQDGVMDCGLTGRDWVAENDADVEEVAALVYAKQEAKPVRWVVAVPNDSTMHTVHDLQGKRIATELVHTTERYLARNGVTAHVEFSWGATEAKVPALVDAIVDVTETGSSLRANNLRIMDTVIESVTVLIANKTAWADPAKRRLDCVVGPDQSSRPELHEFAESGYSFTGQWVCFLSAQNAVTRVHSLARVWYYERLDRRARKQASPPTAARASVAGSGAGLRAPVTVKLSTAVTPLMVAALPHSLV